MKRMRWIFATFAAAALSLALGQGVHASFVQTQRDQISVYVLVNVTPAPLVYAPATSGAKPAIAMNMRMRARGSGETDAVPNFDIGNAVAQSQGAVRVQAEVSPNPNATLLYSNQPVVEIDAMAGTTVTTPDCVYTITVHTLATRSWTLDDGVSSDFTSTFPGRDWRTTPTFKVPRRKQGPHRSSCTPTTTTRGTPLASRAACRRIASL